MIQSYSLGIEFSTQSVKLVILDLNDNNICYSDSINYDDTFPSYETIGGVLPSVNEQVRHTSPFMLIKAVDHAFKILSQSHVDLSMIRAIKTDGMQHCTVYVNSSFRKAISSLDPDQDLLKQISPCISRPSSPIWEDRSTATETHYLTDALKDKGGILHVTGNRAELRFPASQILKWAKENPAEYTETTNIFILSAFITSLLTGKISQVDTGDGWGSNLNTLDIDNPGWSMEAISAMDNYLLKTGIKSPLLAKLGAMDHYDAFAGVINPYFSKKYGISSDTKILTGTGDNPATLLGCGGNMVVSLGSSYTVNGAMVKIIPSKKEEYNVFGYTKGKAMALSVITNGAKVQDHFLKEYLLKQKDRPPDNSDWEKYVNMAGPPLLFKNEKLLLPYLLEESVPLRKKGIIRDNFSKNSAEENIRALILSQVLSLKLHSDQLGEVKDLCVVGGGARNRLMTQWIADVFGAETYTIEKYAVAAPLGCSISAAVKALNISYEEAAKRFVKKDTTSVKKPIPENIKTMQVLVKRYKVLEDRERR